MSEETPTLAEKEAIAKRYKKITITVLIWLTANVLVTNVIGEIPALVDYIEYFYLAVNVSGMIIQIWTGVDLPTANIPGLEGIDFAELKNKAIDLKAYAMNAFAKIKAQLESKPTSAEEMLQMLEDNVKEASSLYGDLQDGIYNLISESIDYWQECNKKK